ncbi:hypothetical protein RHSIM_Rhsim13G0139500 [Rhododendron simsii]|uniref:Uncharacterized protein n=1 Tax=Rhododendron simsii TaxID=118357 RepID=A0A834G164_RHOSS|nr:hypothetical protein RHSIM_Rhsim13G0139500 [Rhododendron simsii]
MKPELGFMVLKVSYLIVLPTKETHSHRFVLQSVSYGGGVRELDLWTDGVEGFESIEDFVAANLE